MTGDVVRAFGERIWTVEGDRVRMLGIPFGTRMTIVRIGNGLWLHSPVNPTAERFKAVAELGNVEHIVAPNKFHHLFVAPWAERFPSAKTWADAGLRARLSDLHFDETLTSEPSSAWRDEIDQVFFAGSKVLPETVFFHRVSRTLIVTDIIQNHDPEEETAFWRTVKRLNGILAPRGGAPRDWRLTVRDRKAARAARDRILAWDFDRLVLSHGRCVDHNARPFVERAFQWLN